MKKQLLRILLVACLLVVLLPTAALAAGTGYELIDGTAGYSDEGPEKLVDGDIKTKWCTKRSGGMPWVIFKTPKPMQVTGYSITTGSDNKENPGRNPKRWKLYGSTEEPDSSSNQWEAIVYVDSDTILQDENSTTYYFNLSSQTGKAYQYFKLDIYDTQGSDDVQMGEFTLTDCMHNWETFTVAATCAKDGYTYRKCSECGWETQKTAGPTATGHIYVDGFCKGCGLKQHIHYLCGGDTCTQTGHTCTERTEFTPWEKTNSLPTESGSYYLTANVLISEAWKPADGTQLCLNGHSISQTSGNYKNPVSAITVEAGRTFTLTDCAATPGMITHLNDDRSYGVLVTGGSFIMYGGKISGIKTSDVSGYDDGGGVLVTTDGSFTMYGGEISGNTAENDGGGVCIKNGSFTMYGGKISGNTAWNDGGGVCIKNGSFIMRGGEISGNNARNNGGGVCLQAGSFTMYGGKISGNNASKYGGGVRVESGNDFTVENGEISNNYAANSGGGISAFGSINLRINNGKINGNTAETNGGGISLVGGNNNDFSATNLYINGGEIRGNKVCYTGVGQQSIYGGGIRTTRATVYMKDGRISENSIAGSASFYSSGAGVAASGVFHMNGGEITNNTNGSTFCGGGGVYVEGTFNMTAGTVSGNNVYGCGGGFMVYGALHMTGGTITGNSAWHGGGVYVATKKRETIDGNSYSNSISSFPANMTVGGTAKVTGNVRRGSKNADTGLYENTEENNVYLPTSNDFGDQKINVLQGKDALTTGAYISVCTQNLPSGEDTIPITSNAPESSAYFHSDRPGYDIGASETAVVLKVGRKVPKLSPDPVTGFYRSEILPSGTASCDGQDVPGTWSWKNGNAPQVLADSSSNGKRWYAVFTPEDTETYDSVTTVVSVTVNPKPLTVNLKPTSNPADYLRGKTREYQPDNYTVELLGGALSGVVGDDDVRMELGTGTLTINTPGPPRDVTTNITLTGADCENYTIVQPTGVTAHITQRYLSRDNSSLPNAVVTLTPSAFSYNGLPRVPSSVTVTLDGYKLTRGKDYRCEITEQTDVGTYEVTVEAIQGSFYRGTIKQTWKITNDPIPEPTVTMTYTLSTNIVTITGLPDGVTATLIAAQYNGSQMVDVRVREVLADVSFPPGTFDKTRGDSYKAFLLSSTGVPLCEAKVAT